MNSKKLTDDVRVAAQISVEDIPLLKEQGVRTVICNRPDNETPDQPPTEALAEAASSAGLSFLHIPVVSGSIGDDDVDDFAKALARADKPILAYCRSGARSTSLWALANVPERGVDTVVRAAADAGYDIAGLRPRLEARAKSE